jgi:riboflavin kinase/FMN adenylyltransferase
LSSILVVGSFDGVHLGHQALVAEAVRLRDKLGAKRVVALAFDPHPMTQLAPAATPARLVAWERKRDLLLAAGADEVVRLEPTAELLAKSGDQFLAWVFERHEPGLIVEGADFHYGKGRDGNVRTLEAFAKSRGALVEVIPGVEVTLGDHQIARASSSLIRAKTVFNCAASGRLVMRKWFL